MSRILRPSIYHEDVAYVLSYDWADNPGAGFGFDCNERGEVLTAGMPEVALENLRKCQNGQHKVSAPRIQRSVNRWKEPAVLRCDCGAEVELWDALTNSCEQCDRNYNMSGQKLAPVEQWEAEDRYACFGPQNGPDDY